MDGQRFDQLAKGLALGQTRRKVVKGLAGGVAAGVAALLGRSSVDARRVTQAICGNEVCAEDPSVCHEECVCCVWGNGNSRCMPPRDCQRAGGEPGGSTPPSQGTCPTGANRCSDGTQLCNGNEDCGCLPTASGGTFCGFGFGNECFACTIDSDCDEVTGPGSACVLDAGCEQCDDTGGRSCWAPCLLLGA